MSRRDRSIIDRINTGRKEGRKEGTHLRRGTVHDVKKISFLIVQNSSVLSGDGGINSHHRSVGLVREGDRVCLSTSKGRSSLVHEKPSPLQVFEGDIAGV